MADLTSSSIVDGGTIEASHITALYDALTGTTVYDNISVTGTSSFALTASYAENATLDTGSLLTTASVSTNTITFTKGDASTFNITVNTGSTATSASFASTIAVTEIGDANNYNMPFIGSADNDISRDSDGEFTYNPDTKVLTVTTVNGNANSANTASYVNASNVNGTVTSASYAITASYALNGGGGGGSTDTGSLLTTASVSNDRITFTKGDASEFDLTINNVVNADTASYIAGGNVDGTVPTAGTLKSGGNLLGLTTASGHIIPATNDTYDLGNAEKKFRDLYLGSNSIYMSGSGGWMTGSWDGTNFKVNNSALIKSSVTSSMTVNKSTITSQTSASIGDGAGSFSIDKVEMLLGTAQLAGGTSLNADFTSVLSGKVLGETCFITATEYDGFAALKGFSVSLDGAGRITVTDKGVGASSQAMLTIHYVP